MLIKWGFIELVNNYSADYNCTKEYKLNDKYIQSKILIFSITDKILLKKFDKYGRDTERQKKSAHCKAFRPHLVKNFDDKLKINAKAAYNLILPMLNNSKQRNSGITALQLITEFHFQQWNYSVKEATDNRLHSNLTRTPKIIRRFLHYDGRPLAGVDIKTSQPYFLLVIITPIAKKDIETLIEIGAIKLLSGSIVDELFSMDFDLENLRKFYRDLKKKEFQRHLDD